MIWNVPHMWVGSTVFILGGGPSLANVPQDAFDGTRGIRTIAVNDSYLRFPRAEIVYFCDYRWYGWHEKRAEFARFAGLKVSMSPQLVNAPDVRTLKQGERHSVSIDPTTLHTGSNSGYQACNLAFLLGAARIVLLGFDMRMIDGRHHWHGGHPTQAAGDVYEKVMIPHFRDLIDPFSLHGCVVVNATPGSALECFLATTLEEELKNYGRYYAERSQGAVSWNSRGFSA